MLWGIHKTCHLNLVIEMTWPQFRERLEEANPKLLSADTLVISVGSLWVLLERTYRAGAEDRVEGERAAEAFGKVGTPDFLSSFLDGFRGGGM